MKRFVLLLTVWALGLAGVLTAVVLPATSAQAVGGLVVSDLNNGTAAAGMAQALAGPGITMSNIVYTGSKVAAGAFSGGTGIIGFDSGLVLGTGQVQTQPNANPADPCAKGVEGPNTCDVNTTDNATAGDPDLDALSGVATNDAAVLEFDFTPVGTKIQLTYVFSSDEYPEYANTEFNDTLAFFVNGVNCALVPNTSLPVSVNTINGGNPLGTNPQNEQYYVDNHFVGLATPSALDTEMDGLTTVLTCNADVTAGETNHMKLAIADGSDPALDSNVFVKAGSLTSGTSGTSGTQIATSLSGGGQTGQSITVPAGTAVSDTATLSGANIATAGGTVAYTQYTNSGCTAGATSAGTKTVANEVVPSSEALTPAAGTYYWQASYSGDAGNDAVTSGCDEVLTVTAVTPTPTPVPVPVPTGVSVVRIAGLDRYATAIAASTHAYPTKGSAGAVVLAGGNEYPDGLVGTPLAKAHNAPLLLTTGTSLPAAVKTEIQRVLPAGGTVYLLGGRGAIPAGVEAQLTNLGFTPVRYAGADRYATALAVAHALGDPATVLLATGMNFPDALAAGAAAAHLGGAILLTRGTAMAAGDSAYLAAHPGQVYAVGGPAAAAAPSATALVGADRYATAAIVATRFFSAPTTVGVAAGTNFPDALSGSALLAGKDGPVLLATAAGLPSYSTTYLTSVKSSVKTAYVFGGTAVVSAAVATAVATALS